jgi:hypothetical protein
VEPPKACFRPDGRIFGFYGFGPVASTNTIRPMCFFLTELSGTQNVAFGWLGLRPAGLASLAGRSRLASLGCWTCRCGRFVYVLRLINCIYVLLVIDRIETTGSGIGGHPFNFTCVGRSQLFS